MKTLTFLVKVEVEDHNVMDVQRIGRRIHEAAYDDRIASDVETQQIHEPENKEGGERWTKNTKIG